MNKKPSKQLSESKKFKVRMKLSNKRGKTYSIGNRLKPTNVRLLETMRNNRS